MTQDEAKQLKHLIGNYAAEEARASEAYSHGCNNAAVRYSKKAEVIYDQITTLIDAQVKP